MRWISNQIKASGANTGVKYCLFSVPKKSVLCEKILKEEGVFDSIIQRDFHLDLIFLDRDVLSMQVETAFKDLFVVSLFFIPY